MTWSSLALWFAFGTSVLFWVLVMIIITPAGDGGEFEQPDDDYPRDWRKRK